MSSAGKGKTEPIKLSKVVFHRVLPPSQIPKVGWQQKSCRTMFIVPLELVKENKRMKKDTLFRCALGMKEDNLELVWQWAAVLRAASIIWMSESSLVSHSRRAGALSAA